MINDYREYEMNEKEIIIYYLGGIAIAYAFAVLFFDFAMLTAFMLPLVYYARKYAEKYLAEKRINRLQTEFVDFLYSVSASVSASMSMEEAIYEARDMMRITYGEESLMYAELDDMISKIKASNTSERALLEDFACRSGIDDFRSFVEGYYICRDSGGDLTKTIAVSTRIISDKLLMEKDMKVMISQKIFEGRLIALMPPGIILFLRLAGPEYLEPLYHGFAGRAIMLFSAGAMAFAFYYAQRLSKVVFAPSIESALPEVMSRLILLLDAGLVLETALERLSASEKAAENIVLGAVARLSEEARIEHTGIVFKLRDYARQSGSRELIRFASILAANIDKGTELSDKLERESDMLWHFAKKEIEEKSKLAETKMTLPMALMLIVLIIITVAPAMMTL